MRIQRGKEWPKKQGPRRRGKAEGQGHGGEEACHRSHHLIPERRKRRAMLIRVSSVLNFLHKSVGKVLC